MELMVKTKVSKVVNFHFVKMCDFRRTWRIFLQLHLRALPLTLKNITQLQSQIYRDTGVHKKLQANLEVRAAGPYECPRMSVWSPHGTPTSCTPRVEI